MSPAAAPPRTITSLTNPTVKAVRALHMRKAREETGLFLVEGLKSVTEAIALGRTPRTLLHGESAADHPLLRRAVAEADETLIVSAAILEKISRRDNPQAVLGVFEQVFTPFDALDPGASRCWVALEAVRDPGNLGTIIRTADAAGCGGVILARLAAYPAAFVGGVVLGGLPGVVIGFTFGELLAHATGLILVNRSGDRTTFAGFERVAEFVLGSTILMAGILLIEHRHWLGAAVAGVCGLTLAIWIARRERVAIGASVVLIRRLLRVPASAAR